MSGMIPFRNASVLQWVEPLKRKKRLDPAIVKAKQERAKKRIEKSIRLLQRVDRCLRPIEEATVPLILKSNQDERRRSIEVPEDVKNERVLLTKEWSRIKSKYIQLEKINIKRLLTEQDKALKELRKESEELYKAAIQIDMQLIPFSFKGPVETPSIENYPTPDGDYEDISRDWSKEVA